MKIGVLGGSFDPIHYGHLLAAEEVRFRLQLSEVLFVPAGQPPHKLTRTLSPIGHRLTMVRLAIASNPRFRLSRVDVDRPGPHYSVDTVALLRQQLGPDVEIYFVVGLDSLMEIGTWREPERLMRECRVVGVSRPGYEDLSKLAPEVSRAAAGNIVTVPIPEVGTSSSNLRERVRNSAPIKYQLPEAVEEYIFQHGLYR
ncbi:MAG: nicotinate-nucleotide adenylyltransferase [Chloroflexi bacterium]|nr:nicotinate-nucleotide adenylyltransferase [Chloroflexota bacterium]